MGNPVLSFCQNLNTEERTDRPTAGYPKALEPSAKRIQGPERAPLEVYFTVVHTRLVQTKDGHTRFLPL